MIRRAIPFVVVFAVACVGNAPVVLSETRKAAPAPVESGWATTIEYARRASPKASNVATGSLPPVPAGSAKAGHELDGMASYYWQAQGTASGEPFDRAGLTAAHRTLPFGTKVRVTNVANGQAVVVRINDRGPFKPGRVIDLSDAAAGAIGMRGKGLAKVKVEVVN